MKTAKIIGTVAAASLLAGVTAKAVVTPVEVTPLSYVSDVAPTEPYGDTGNVELINNLHGGVDVYNSQWVGYGGSTPTINIDFTLPSETTVNSIVIGALNWPQGAVLGPAFNIFSASTPGGFGVTPITTVPSVTSGEASDLSYVLGNLNIMDQYIRVQVVPNLGSGEVPGYWSFLDEVDFFTNVPDSGSAMAMLGVALMGLGSISSYIRKSKKS